MTAIKRFIVAAVLVFGVLTDQAQSESAVQSTAEANGLTAAGPTPIGSTFMTVIWTGAVLPYPFLPPGTDLPVYTLDASNSVYLVDDTATTNTITAAELTAQTNAVLALIAEYQPPPPVESRGARADLDYSPLSPGGANGSYTLTNDGAFQPNTNEVWLAITNVIISEQLASLNLYVPTNVIISGTTNIYAIWTTTNLAAGWQVAAEVWLPYPAPATNPVVVPFTLPIWQSLEMPAASPALFFKAQAWTDWTISGNVAPVWWTWEFFALTNVSDLSADCDGHTLRYDYTNNLPPAEPPIITEDPGNEMVLAGDAVFLDAALAAPAIYASQWFFNGAPVMSNLITTVAGGGENAPSDSGPATNAYISGPQGVAVDRARNIYIADSYDSLVLRVDTNGIITTVAGSLNGAGYSGDGGKATNAILNYPSAVVLDHQGNLYIADQCNNLIRRVGTNGYISTVAGDSIHQTAGYYGDGGTATNAYLDNPSGVAVDPAGNLWIADTRNNVVRRVGTNGIITTVAGNYALGANYGGDGYPATNAELSSPSGVAVDASGNLYIADANNNVIRKVAVDGIITTVAGNYYSSALYTNYPGAAATNVTLSLPADVAIDSAGNLYIVDTDDGVIRLVDAEGIISTVAGSNSLNGLGISGDGGPGPDAGLYYPGGAAVDGAGNLYIADTGDSRVRCVTPVNRADQTNEYINLTISSAQTNSTGSYAVVLTDACGSITSSIASVVVGVPPVIIRQPVNQFLLLGDDAVFQVVATAFPAPAYQWYFGSNILAGATNATFSIASFTTNNLGNYHVAVTNYFGAVTSAISTVSAAGNDVGSLNAVEVYAGADETLTNAIFPTTDTSFQLQGVILGASGNTPLGSCVATWSVVSAPAGASVRFVDPNLTNSIVTVANGPSNAGPYRFRLTLADGQSAVSSDVVIMLVQLEPFPYLATNYLYAYSLSNSLTNFFAITNYDGAWSGGQAGFGNYVDQCGPVYSTYWPGYAFYDPYLYIRRPFMVPAGTTNLTLSFAIDNDAQLFLNGTLLTPATNTLFHGLVVTQNVAHVTLGYGGSGFSTRFDTQSTDENTSSSNYGQEVYLTNVFGHGGCSDTNELVLSGLSTNVWHTGSNLLVAMVYDAGVASYFDSQIAWLPRRA